MASFLPESLTPSIAFILIIASFFTSGLTAAAGVGGGVLMLGLMTYLIPISALIPVHGVIQLGSNLGRSWVQRHYIDWHITRLFLVGAFFGALAGAILFVELPTWVLQGLLGIFILIMIGIPFPKVNNPGPFLIASGGLITSFFSMFAGATGPLVATFMHNLFSEHRKMVATHGTTMSVQHGLKVFAFILTGFAFWEWLPLIIAVIASGFIGTWAGTFLLNKLPQKILKSGFKLIMVFIALDLINSGFLTPVKK